MTVLRGWLAVAFIAIAVYAVIASIDAIVQGTPPIFTVILIVFIIVNIIGIIKVVRLVQAKEV